MRHFHGDGDDVNARAIHELFMIVVGERHAKELAGGVGRLASRGRNRRDLKVIGQRLQRRNVRLLRPPAIRIGADDPDTDLLGSAVARRGLDQTAQATAATSAALSISTSSASLTSSPTRKPPVSSATFQVRPQSLRVMLVCALKPAWTPPIGSFACPEYTTSSVTGRVTFRMVRSPVILYWS